MISKNILRTLVLPAAFMLSPAQAVVIGGWDVAEFATFSFGDTSGSYDVTNTGSFITAAGDTSVETFVSSSTGTSTLGLTFAAGTLVDGTGFDLVLFEIGTAESMNVTVNGVDLGLFTPSTTGENIGLLPPTGEARTLNSVAIDFNGTGIDLSGGATILLGLTQGGADFALAGALNPPPVVVPVPAAVWLFGSGLLGLAGFARRKK